MFHPEGGTIGWLAFPFMALFEWIGPAIEVRQVNSVWKLIGLYRWVRGEKATWGAMMRTASWQAR